MEGKKELGELDSRKRLKRIEPRLDTSITRLWLTVTAMYLEDIEELFEFFEVYSQSHKGEAFWLRGLPFDGAGHPVTIQTHKHELTNLEQLRSYKPSAVPVFRMHSPSGNLSLHLERSKCVLVSSKNDEIAQKAVDQISAVVEVRRSPILRKCPYLAAAFAGISFVFGPDFLPYRLLISAALSTAIALLIFALLAGSYYFGIWHRRPAVAIFKYREEVPKDWKLNPADILTNAFGALFAVAILAIIGLIVTQFR